MKLRPAFITFLLLTVAITASARDIDGYVHDESGSHAVRGARISILGTDQFTYTNKYGYFSLSVRGWTAKLVVSANGYDLFELQMDSSSGDHLEIYLPKSDYLIPEEVSNEARIPSSLTNPVSGYLELSMDIQSDLPVIASEMDPVKTMQMLPGVEFGREGMGELFVRGGGARQNLYNLNGIPVYGDNHAFGFLSVFHPREISNISLYRGAYPARFGGRLSSVVDVTSFYGSKEGANGYSYASPLTIGFGINGPIGENGKTSFSISGRRSYLDILLLPLFNSTGMIARFYDVQLNWETRLSDATTLQFHSFFANNKYVLPLVLSDSAGSENWDLGWHYTTVVGGMKLNHAFTKRHFGSFSVGYSFYSPSNTLDIRRNNTSVDEAMEYDIRFSTGNFDVIAGADMEWRKSSQHFIRYGSLITMHGFNTGRYNEESRNPLGEVLNTVELGDQKPSIGIQATFYAEDEITLRHNLILNAGARLVLYQYKSLVSPHFEPRIMLAYRWNETSTLKLSYMRVNQFLHSLNNDGASISMNRWIPSDKETPPAMSNQFNLAWVKHISGSSEFQIEGYYKSFSNLYLERGATSTNSLINYSSLLYKGTGYAYGAEFYIHKMMGNFTGYASYSLANSERVFEDLNGKEAFPFNFDRRHNFKLGGRLVIDSEYTFTFNIVLGSGLPYTLPNSIYRDINGEIILGYEQINNYRAEWYRRLDLGVTKFENGFHEGGQKLNLSIYNVFGMKNTSNVTFERDDESPELKYNAFKNIFFVFIPGIRYELIF